jgi:hypothetical protein
MGGHFVRSVLQRLRSKVGALGKSVNGLLGFLQKLCLGFDLLLSK